jgi:hypothetical protein
MNWHIVSIECKPLEGTLSNVATVAHWTLSDTDGELTASVYGSQSLPEADPADFTPYEDLTEATVVSWVQAAMGEEQVAAYEANVTAQLETLANPPVVSLPVPWSVSI